MTARKTIVLFALAVLLSGCGGGREKTEQAASTPSVAAVPSPPAVSIGPTTPPPSTITRFTDIPVPPNNVVDLERTVMVGSEADWLGRILLTTPMETSAVWEFYRREMPRYGWHEIAAHWRPANSVLFYQLNNRVATIELASRAGLTQVEFWMNPRNANTASGGASLRVPAVPLAEGGPSVGRAESVGSPPPAGSLPGTALEEAPAPPPPWH